jgi:DNA-binding response OmpR family regulator
MKILIVEDSKKLSHSLRVGLQNTGYVVDAVGNGKEAIHCLELNQYEVMVLDIMMPGLDGFGVLEWLKLRNLTTRVIVLSARDTVTDRVKGLEKGANDYLVKPFAFDELVARIRVQSREYHHVEDIITVGQFELDVKQRTIAFKGQLVPLSLREYNIVEFLCLRKNSSFLKEALRNHLYDFDKHVDSQVIEVMVSNIRKKLKEMEIDAPLIQTRRGYGYLVAG